MNIVIYEGKLQSASQNDKQVLEMFLATKGQRSLNTARVYAVELEKFFATVNKPLKEITYSDLISYAQSLEGSPATRARILTTIRSFFRFAVKLGYLKLNPAELLEVPKVPNTSANRFLTKQEIEKILLVAKEEGVNKFMPVLFLSLTGCRINEVVSLTWDRFFQDLDGNIGVRVLGKGNKERVVKISPVLWQVILEYRKANGLPTELGQEGPFIINTTGRGNPWGRKGKSSPVKEELKGRPMSDRNLRAMIGQLAKKAGITKKVSPHWFRHSFATLALFKGAPIVQVQADLGHGSITTTQRYLHVANQLKQTSVDFIDLAI